LINSLYNLLFGKLVQSYIHNIYYLLV
jgi:hypothetical protein